jgi:hypothetical protein
MIMKQADNNVAVLLIFFTRKETLEQTFEAIRQARPSHLFLYQDGPRNEEEAAKLAAARSIVADDRIDWQCDVQRNYHTENSGAWASNYQAQRWAFSLYDKCIVLEDDSTPAISFIPFCTELLNRYENDERIAMIAGFNHEEYTEAPYDYLFTTAMPVWGWASWRRVIDRWDSEYSVVDDPFNMHQLEANVHNRKEGWKEMLVKMRKHKQGGQPIYETLLWSACTLYTGLAIIPTRNMIHNAGVSMESAHYQRSLRTLPKRMQQLLTMPSHEMSFPLRHPMYVIENVEYKKRLFRAMAWEHPWIKVGRSMEELYRCLRYGEIVQIWHSLKHRIRKATGRFDYK